MLYVLNFAFQYVENVPNWNQACENVNIPCEIIILETAIHQHQNLYESMCQAYTEVRYLFIYLNFDSFFILIYKLL